MNALALGLVPEYTSALKDQFSNSAQIAEQLNLGGLVNEQNKDLGLNVIDAHSPEYALRRFRPASRLALRSLAVTSRSVKIATRPPRSSFVNYGGHEKCSSGTNIYSFPSKRIRTPSDNQRSSAQRNGPPIQPDRGPVSCASASYGVGVGVGVGVELSMKSSPAA
ncbi:hypothetical protein NYA9BBAC_02219 [Salinibacterium sp. NYA9b]